MIASEMLEIIRDCDSDILSGFDIESQDVNENQITLTGFDQFTGEPIRKTVTILEVEFVTDDCRYDCHRDHSESGYVVEVE